MTPRLFQRLAAFIVAVALSTEVCLAQPRPAAQGALIVTLSGKVEVSFVGSSVWTPTHTNETLRIGDRIRTGKSSRATLRLSNQSVLRVYELTTLEIQAPGAGARTSLNLQSGAAYFFDRDKPLETQFRTPSASGAIRGTEFNLVVDANGRTELDTLDGEVGLTNEQGSVSVNAGEKAVAEPGRAPAKSPLLDAVNVIQWTLYYPGVVDPDELGLDDSPRSALSASLDAYHAGDLLQALAHYPDNRSPASDAEKVYRASLLLGVGNVSEAQDLLKDANHPLASPVQEIIAAVKGEPFSRTAPRVLATEFLAGSYAAQSRHDLPAALRLAQAAAAKDPHFGFALERLAEMEFSFGHTDRALAALQQSLQVSPRNAQALALQGFVFSAKNKIPQAADYFNRAIAADGALANGWLGKGLVEILHNNVNAGRKDLETAAALEPNRAFLRSYLGKAWSMDQPTRYSWDTKLARRELDLSKKLDPRDPTAWLYSALLADQRNCINEAIKDLEESEVLNNNRAVFRSKFLLDQDQAVRAANLALIYEDAGFSDVATREATRAVEDDYANYSAHLFLSDSYDALIDPRKSNLRYETPWEDELLLANLLSPANAGALSQNISQQEYSSMFESDRFGLISQTEFLSQGAWLENLSQFGHGGDYAYALDYYHYSDPGFRPNNDINDDDADAKAKIQLTEKDTLFVQGERSEVRGGDVNQYYLQSSADPNIRTTEIEDPSILLSYHRQWSPGQDTLVLYRNLQESYTQTDPAFAFPEYTFFNGFGGTPPSVLGGATPLGTAYQDQTQLNSFEAQHIMQTENQRIIVGGRYQAQNDQVTNFIASLPSQTSLNTDFTRYSLYAYYQYNLFDQLRLTGGVDWDDTRFPMNIANSPIISTENERSKISPKAGLDWTPNDNLRLRAAYTRSASGLFNSSSTLIEPSEIAGFNQVYRTLLSQVATAPYTEFETWSAGADYKFPTRTYVNITGQILHSSSDQDVGAILNDVTLSPASIDQNIQLREKDLILNVDQLIGKDWSVGAGYQLTQARANFQNQLTAFSPSVSGVSGKFSEDALLHQFSLFANYYLPCGFFSRAELGYWRQFDDSFGEDGGHLWQANIYAGYRFPRRHIEIQVGALNLFDENYTIDPLTYYIDPVRRRTFEASLKLSF